MKEALPQKPLTPHPKLDPRLTTLVELGAGAFAQSGPGSLEAFDADGSKAFHRPGPLAFLRVRPSYEVATVTDGGVAPRVEVPMSVPVFIRTRTPAALDRLAASGLGLVSRARTIGTAEVALSRIAALEADEDVISIEWTGACRPLATAASPGAPRGACAAIGLDPGRFGDLDGHGAVIGVVDLDGLDLYHGSFVNRRARSCVRALWDQRVRAPAGAERGPGALGVVHRRHELNLEVSPRQLDRGSVVDHRARKGSHGTQTAGFAVGNGDERPDARGVAPRADLVFVNTWSSGPGAIGAMTELADAIAFAFAEADALGKPCVVNVSMGDDLGPRDGTSPVERFIDELLETEGRAVVVAAGNAQGKDRHVTATLADGDTATFSLLVAPRNTDRAVVEIWYRRQADADASLSVEIEAPRGGGVTPPIEPDGLPRAFDVENNRILALSMVPYPGSTNCMVRVEILPHSTAEELIPGTFKLHLRARGQVGAVHAWVDHPYIHWEKASDTLTLTTPATARKAIVVGAYDGERDEQACFSGRGEDRGGLSRPDVLAPGVSMVASWAESPVRYVATACGTSVAAPIVSGVAALVFQRLGRSAGEGRVREQILALTRPVDGGPGRLWVEGWPMAEGALEAPAGTAAEEPVRRERSERGAPPGRWSERTQIIQGHYRLLVEREIAGELLVLPGDRPGASVEHWALAPGYLAPSAERAHAAMEFHYLGTPMTLARFRARLGPGFQHVDAHCEVIWRGRRQARMWKRSAASGEESMKGARSKEMGAKNYMRPSDRTQIIQGKYELYQSETLVGLLRVTDDSPGVSTEHWLLYDEYQWPSSTNDTQEIVFKYISTPGNLGDFLEDPPADTTYIIAACSQQTLP